MSAATYIVGDVFDVMASMPDASVDLVLTSPPFLALRSYLPADHPDKHKEIGSEPTPAEFIDTLLALTAEWGRLIAPHGSIAVELGDTYAGSGGAGGDYGEGGMRDGQGKADGAKRRMTVSARRDRTEVPRNLSGGNGWPLDKSMCLIPHAYAMSLAYGRNILTGEPSPAGSWRVRNVVAWCRPNPAVGALGDKFRPATSFMVIATKARDRWFDLDAVRTPYSPNTNARTAKGVDEQERTGKSADRDGNWSSLPERNNDGAGAPPLDHWWHDDEFDQDAWLVSTESYRGSHYATWPRKLLDRPILAMCPRHVCVECGAPRRRIVGEATYEPSATNRGGVLTADAERVAEGANQFVGDGGAGRASVIRSADTLGWTDCGHDNYRRGRVLDPFGGSGTTGAVSVAHGRDCVLIDIDERNADLAQERIGMFLTVGHPSERCSAK